MVAQLQNEANLSSAMNAKFIGSGERLMVLAHGFGGDQSVWEKITPILSRNFKILIFDWLFSGAVKDQSLFVPSKYTSYESFADDLICLMEQFKFGSDKPVVFVGHSMSGMIGCIASVKRPELFERLVLLSASPRYINSEDYQGGFTSKDIDVITSNIESNYDAWATAFASAVVDPKDTVSVHKFEKCLKRMKHETALSLAKTVFGSDERDLLPNVTLPCTIIQPQNDAVVPISVAYYMQEKIKGKSTVQIIEECQGHFPQLTSHIPLLDVMRDVLQF